MISQENLRMLIADARPLSIPLCLCLSSNTNKKEVCVMIIFCLVIILISIYHFLFCSKKSKNDAMFYIFYF